MGLSDFAEKSRTWWWIRIRSVSWSHWFQMAILSYPPGIFCTGTFMYPFHCRFSNRYPFCRDDVGNQVASVWLIAVVGVHEVDHVVSDLLHEGFLACFKPKKQNIFIHILYSFPGPSAFPIEKLQFINSSLVPEFTNKWRVDTMRFPRWFFTISSPFFFFLQTGNPAWDGPGMSTVSAKNFVTFMTSLLNTFETCCCGIPWAPRWHVRDKLLIQFLEIHEVCYLTRTHTKHQATITSYHQQTHGGFLSHRGTPSHHPSE